MDRYYDLVLGLIPLALIGIAGSLVVAGVEHTVALPLAGTVAVGLIGHAIFVNGPVDRVVDHTTDTEAESDSFSAGAD